MTIGMGERQRVRGVVWGRRKKETERSGGGEKGRGKGRDNGMAATTSFLWVPTCIIYKSLSIFHPMASATSRHAVECGDNEEAECEGDRMNSTTSECMKRIILFLVPLH